MAYSRDAFFRDQQETRERQDQRDMEIWRMAYHSLTRYLERARDQRESQRGDMELFRQLDDGQTNKQTNKQTFKFNQNYMYRLYI